MASRYPCEFDKGRTTRPPSVSSKRLAKLLHVEVKATSCVSTLFKASDFPDVWQKVISRKSQLQCLSRSRFKIAASAFKDLKTAEVGCVTCISLWSQLMQNVSVIYRHLYVACLQHLFDSAWCFSGRESNQIQQKYFWQGVSSASPFAEQQKHK